MDDLREHLDASIGAGPPHRDLAPLLAAGRRAVRRRRIASGAAVVAVVGVIGTTLAVGQGTPDAARDLPATGQSSATTDPSPSDDDPSEARTEPPAYHWQAGELATYTADGRLQIRPGVQVLDRVDDYLHGSPVYDRSVALDVRYRGVEQWMTLEWSGGDSSGSGASSSGAGYSDPSDGWADFRAWVADQAAANGVGGPGGTGYPDLVFPSDTCDFKDLGYAEILAQATEGLPDSYVRAAEVRLEGKRYLVMCRITAGKPDLVTIHAEGHGADLAQLLAYARGKYASGEGVR